MAEPEDASGDIAAEIQRCLTQTLQSLVQIQTDLLSVQQRLTPGQFRQWAITEAGLDAATLKDFLAFNGRLEGMTEHMLRWFMTLVD